jgi:hypothetical protein
MSRSYRRPYCAITGLRSAAHDKMVARRSWRRAQNQELQKYVANDFDWDEFLTPERYEASFNDVWSWGIDGKQYLHFPPPPPENDSEFELGWYERQVEWYARLHRK